MEYLKRIISGVNPSTLSGAIDVIVIEQPDGSLRATPFHVRFGASRVLMPRERVVEVSVNDVPVNLAMKVGAAGEAFFVEEVVTSTPAAFDTEELTSPICSDSEDYGDSLRRASATTTMLKESKLGEKVAKQDVEKPLQRANSWHSLHELVLNDAMEAATLSSTSVIPFAESDTAIDKDCVMVKKRAYHRRRPRKRATPTLNQSSSSSEEDFVGAPAAELDDDDDDNTEETTESFMTPMVESRSINRFVAETENRESSGVKSRRISEPVISVTSMKSALSDSHLDLHDPARLAVEDARFDNLSWEWGKFPRQHQHSDLSSASCVVDVSVQSVEQSKPPPTKNNKQPPHSSNSSGSSPEKGVYLQDIDAELSNLYIYRSQHSSREAAEYEEHCAAAAAAASDQRRVVSPDIGYKSDSELGPQITASHIGRLTSQNRQLIDELALSLCGGLSTNEKGPSWERFVDCLVTYEEFARDPAGIISNENLVLRFNGEYMNWAIAGPRLMSCLAFSAELPNRAVEQLRDRYLPRHGAKHEESDKSSTSTSRDKKRGGVSSWFSWAGRRHQENATTSPAADSNNETEATIAATAAVSSTSLPLKASAALIDSVEKEKNAKAAEIKRSTSSEVYIRSNRLSSKQLLSLGLRPGCNTITYGITTALQGTAIIVGHIYYWHWTDKLVISDIDGTITRSDVLGHILPRFWMDWTHRGVATLFSEVKNNGYKFVYLSARAIGLARDTRHLLKWIKQGEMCLPDGPLLVNPCSLIRALGREVITRNPEVFKISCLQDVQSLFPAPNAQPFWSGFGNRPNDEVSYLAVGIPSHRCFTVNPHGIVKRRNSCVFETSYDQLAEMVDHVFPPLLKRQVSITVECSQCADTAQSPVQNAIHFDSMLNYWSMPLPDLDLDRELAAAAAGTASSLVESATADSHND